MIVNYKCKPFIVQATVGLYYKLFIILAFVLNFHNCCKIFTAKLPWPPFKNIHPLLKSPIPTGAELSAEGQVSPEHRDIVVLYYRPQGSLANT